MFSHSQNLSGGLRFVCHVPRAQSSAYHIAGALNICGGVTPLQMRRPESGHAREVQTGARPGGNHSHITVCHRPTTPQPPIYASPRFQCKPRLRRANSTRPRGHECRSQPCPQLGVLSRASTFSSEQQRLRATGFQRGSLGAPVFWGETSERGWRCNKWSGSWAARLGFAQS